MLPPNIVDLVHEYGDCNAKLPIRRAAENAIGKRIFGRILKKVTEEADYEE